MGIIRMKTPDYLLPALRQYRHNDMSNELVFGLDHDETIQIVENILHNYKQTDNQDVKYSKKIFRVNNFICAEIYRNDRLFESKTFNFSLFKTMCNIEPTEKTYVEAHKWADKVIELERTHSVNKK